MYQQATSSQKNKKMFKCKIPITLLNFSNQNSDAIRSTTSGDYNKLLIVWNLNKIHWAYCVACTNSTKSHNSCKICQIKTAVQYDQQQMVTNNNPTKVEKKSMKQFQRSYIHKCDWTPVFLCPLPNSDGDNYYNY